MVDGIFSRSRIILLLVGCMRFWLLIPMLLWGFLFNSISVVQAQEPPSSQSEKLKQQVVSNRMAIRSGSAKVTIAKPGMEPFVWKMWHGGDNKLRLEQFREGKKIVSIQNGDDFFEAISDVKMSPDRRDQSNPDNYIVDLRVLGVLPVSTTALSSFPNLFEKFSSERNDGAEISTTTGEDDRSLKLIDWKHGSYHSQYWIDESKGPSVIRAEVTNVVNGKVIRDTLVNEMQHVDEIWFPEKISYRRTVDGEGPPADELIIEDVHFNEDIDPDLFSLKSFGLAPGTYVNDNPSHPDGPRFWDGEKLVFEERPAKKSDQPLANPVAAKQTLRWWLIYGNLVFGMICIVIWWKVRRLKSK